MGSKFLYKPSNDNLTNSTYGPYTWIITAVMEPVKSSHDLQVINNGDLSEAPHCSLQGMTEAKGTVPAGAPPQIEVK